MGCLGEAKLAIPQVPFLHRFVGSQHMIPAKFNKSESMFDFTLKSRGVSHAKDGDRLT